MKRIISLLICFVMIMSLGLCVNAAGFSDLSKDHWAYKNIETLVNEGTINGYEDGTFRPSKSVTRAEFVKMIGKWDKKHAVKFNDISEQHWAYEYIMWSGLEPIGNSIRPDVEIKRADVINLIWKRNGSPKSNAAPSAIISQGTNADATSWAYTIGLMKGDDGLNLRLDSSLTRAEAATLIIRSREVVSANKTNNFIDVVSDDLLKTVYESLNILGEEYNENRTFTYGELARIAIDLGADGSSSKYSPDDAVISELFDHKYSKDFYALSYKVWGKGNYKKNNIDSKANIQDAVSALVYAMARRGVSPSDMYKLNDYYSDCTNAKDTDLENLYLTYANTKGIKLYAGNKLHAKEELTAKKLAALLLQINDTIGLAVSYSGTEKKGAKMNTNLALYPANYKDYHITLSDVPARVYSLKADGENAKNYYTMASSCAYIFTTYMSEVKSIVKKQTAYEFDSTFYPSLAYKENGKVVFWAKIVVKSTKNESSKVSVDELFNGFLGAPTGKTVETGQEFYVAFKTFGPLMDIYLPYTGAYINAIVIP